MDRKKTPLDIFIKGISDTYGMQNEKDDTISFKNMLPKVFET